MEGSVSDVLDAKQKRIEALEINLREISLQQAKVTQQNELLKLQVHTYTRKFKKIILIQRRF